MRDSNRDGPAALAKFNRTVRERNASRMERTTIV
jgi:hypothetical protein